MTYIIIGGAAIGSRRNKHLIPWDDDVDVAVFHEAPNEYPNMMRRITDALTPHFRVEPVHFGVKLFERETKNADCFIDVFFMSPDPDDRQLITYSMPNTAWLKKYWLKKDEIERLDTIELAGKEYPCHSNIDNVLSRWYGSTWKDEPKITHVHKSLPWPDNWLLQLMIKFNVNRMK